MLGPIYVGDFSVDPRLVNTVKKIKSFEHLSPGWNYGRGGPISPSVISDATAFLWKFALSGLNDTDAFPGINGEVMVTAYEGEHYVEAIVEADGSISLTYEVNDVENFSKERMDSEEATRKLQEISGGIWNMFDFCIRTISTPTLDKIGSRVWLSEIPLMEVGHPLSNALALTQPAAAFVTTYDVTTPLGLQTNHPFFGNLTKASLQRDIG